MAIRSWPDLNWKDCSSLPVTNAITPPAEAPVKDVDTPDSKESSEELKSDETGKEGRPAYLNSGAAMTPLY
ncbi:unnamed protein product [Calypogeia fissa]